MANITIFNLIFDNVCNSGTRFNAENLMHIVLDININTHIVLHFG
jgi:hypothetical protein